MQTVVTRMVGVWSGGWEVRIGGENVYNLLNILGGWCDIMEMMGEEAQRSG